MGLTSFCRALAGAGCLAVLGWAMPALAGGNLGNIMPLGDSITEGTVPGSYRDPLATLLTAAGYTFHFVGSNTSNATTALINSGNNAHEGHSGYTISAISGRPGIDDNLESYIGPGHADPDYILLMIGTNDVDTGNSATAASRLSTLISHISNATTGYRPNAHLIVASIVPINDATEELQVQSYNAGVLADVQAHQALGENVTFLDMHSYLTTADLGDKLHPNQGGYNKMAAAWMDGIQAVPEPTTALLLPLLGLLMRRRAR